MRLTRSSSALRGLAILLAVVAYAAEQKPKQEFEAVPAPQLQIQAPDLDKKSPPEQPPAQTNPPAAPAPATFGLSAEDWKKVQEEVDRGREASSGSAQQPAVTTATADSSRSPGMSVIRAIIATSVVVALILVCYYLANRYGKKNPLFAGSSLGKILGRIYLSPKAELFFVRVKDRVLVVGVTSNGVSSLAEFDASMFEEAQTAAAPTEKRVAAPTNFEKELRAQTLPEPSADAVADELAALKAELDRARQYFRDTTGESGAL